MYVCVCVCSFSGVAANTRVVSGGTPSAVGKLEAEIEKHRAEVEAKKKKEAEKAQRRKEEEQRKKKLFEEQEAAKKQKEEQEAAQKKEEHKAAKRQEAEQEEAAAAAAQKKKKEEEEEAQKKRQTGAGEKEVAQPAAVGKQSPEEEKKEAVSAAAKPAAENNDVLQALIARCARDIENAPPGPVNSAACREVAALRAPTSSDRASASDHAAAQDPKKLEHANEDIWQKLKRLDKEIDEAIHKKIAAAEAVSASSALPPHKVHRRVLSPSV